MKVKVLEQKPSAHITKKKSRLKVYNGHKLFLNDKDNFELELFNPKKYPVLCKVKFNGNYISNNGIVLRPGERVFLERFIDDNKKFVFNTYNVDDNNITRDAIELNGDVYVEFYDEKKEVNFNHTWDPNVIIYRNGLTPPYTVTCANYTTNTLNMNYLSTSNNSSIETGRIEKGNKSNQSFDYVDNKFYEFVSHTVKYKILPLNEKLKTSDDIKNYCNKCGGKIKSKWKFCPVCGSEL